MIKRNKISYLLFSAATVLILGLGILSYQRLITLTRSGNWVNHTNLVKLTIEKIGSSLSSAESQQRGFLLTRDSSFLKQKAAVLARLPDDLHTLDSLVSDNPEQKKNLALLRQRVENRLNALSAVLYNNTPVIFPPLRNATLNGKTVMNQVRVTMKEMTDHEDALLKQRQQNYDHQLKLAPASLLVLGTAAVAILFISFYLLNEALQKSRRLQISEFQLEEKVKERTAELLQRNEFVETVFDTSIDLISVYDRQMRIISFNKAFEKLFGLQRGDVLGKSVTDIFPAIKETRGYNDLEKALKGEAVHNTHYVSPISGRIYENFILPLVNPDGSVYAIVSIAHDNTEMIKASEEVNAVNAALNARNEFVETLVNVSPDSIVVIDKELQILTVNNKALELFNVFYQGTVTGKKFTDLIPSLLNSQVHHDILKAFEGETVVRENYKSGILDAHFIQSFIPLKNEREVYAVMLVSHNITDLIAMTGELLKTNSALEKTNEELSSFAYIASHDLQEPLRKIQMFVQRIKERDERLLSPEARDYFDRIENSSHRMQRLILDLLAYSGTTAHDKHFEKIDLNLLLQQVVTDLKEKIEESHTSIHVSTLPELVIIPFQFHQLFTNLISNSIKFSKPGVPAEININSSIVAGADIKEPNASAATKYHLITFSDNGIGFDARYHEQIFKLFQRLHGRHEYEGTGIGLSIVKKIVDNHHGFITAHGEPNKGATFEIYIPVA